MGKLRDAVGQQHIDFESPDARRARAALEQFDTLEGQALIDALIANGIYRSDDEMRSEFRAGVDPRAADFGGKYTFVDFLQDTKRDWAKMLRMVADGDAKNGVEAREKFYGGGDVVTVIRRNEKQSRDRARNVLKQPKPR